MFQIVISLGNLLVDLMTMLFEWAWVPIIMKLHGAIAHISWLDRIFVGNLIEGTIDLEGSMGVLSTGIFVPIGLVMPYLLLFYLILGFLEDWGYLPRMAVLFDRFFHRIGLHGYSVIPMMLATGCNIPGVLALRNLETRRERFITAAIMSTAIPCMAQSAIIFRETGKFGSVYLWLTLTSLLTVAVVLGVLLNAYSKGNTPTLIAEMPSYRVPGTKMQLKKLAGRLSGFFKEAVPLMMLGILLVQVLLLTGVLDVLFKSGSAGHNRALGASQGNGICNACRRYTERRGYCASCPSQSYRRADHNGCCISGFILSVRGNLHSARA